MITKKHKRISLLVFVSMLFSLLPVNTFNVSASSKEVSLPTLTETVKYSEFFSELTTFINEKVGDDTSKGTLTNYLKDANFEKAIAQREFIRKAGASTIEEFANTQEKKNFINWILNNEEAMSLFLEGGEAESTYLKALNLWFEIFTKDSDSHSGYELRLAVATAVKLGNGVPKWYTKRTLVTPYERYEYYKVREAEGKFPISMKTRTVWELRNIVKAPCSNWDLDYARDILHKGRYSTQKQRVSISRPPYTATSIYKDKNGNPYSVFRASGDQFFGPDATLKEVRKIGGVCGTQSKFSSIVNNAFGIPAFNVGQPGHAAYVYHSPKSVGNWDLGYNISGWGKSVNRQSKYVPYTNHSDVSNRPAYWFAYEAAREDEEALHKSHQLKWIATALKDYSKAQSVRKVAIEIDKWNVDIWRDYVNAVKNLWNKAKADTKIPSDKITATATSSHSSSQGASKAIDGNSSTIWHTKYGRNKANLPQSITLSFDKEYEISRFEYYPRKSGSNGRITEYNLYTSLDGKNYSLVSHGTWSDNSSTKTVQFETRNAKYVKLEALKGHGGYATASEIKVYRPFKDKPISQKEREELGDFIIAELGEQPRVAYDLFRSVKGLIINKGISREKYQEYIVNLNSMIYKAYSINSKQKQIAQEVKNSITSSGLTLADFNFDGSNAGRIMKSKTDSEYSLDGGKTFKPITEDNMKLSPEEIESITAENNIKIRIKGTDKYVTIPINKRPDLPQTQANDDINRIFGLNEEVYFSTDNGKTWTQYKDESGLPDLSGDLKFMVKIPAKGKTLRSVIKTYNFTTKVNPSLILPSEIIDIKTDVVKSNSTKCIYNGNIFSYFHTNYDENKRKFPQSVTLELKDPSDIYKLEYVPRQSSISHGRISQYNIYTSSDGKNFTLVSKGTWAKDMTTKTAEFNSKGVKYVKFEALAAEKNYISIGELRLYKTEKLTPKVSFSFDGTNKGKLLGSNKDMEYSLDGGTTWKNVTTINMTLPSEEISKLKVDSKIKVRFKNTTAGFEISFKSCEKIPNVQGDNTKNTVTGLDKTMEYSIDLGKTWTSYNGTFNTDLRGNVDLYVRYKASGTTFPSENLVLKYNAEETEKFDGRVVYKLTSKATGRSVEVKSGSRSDNAQVVQHGVTGWSRQTVYLVSVSQDQYKIVSKLSGKVLAPKDSSKSNGATLVQTTYKGEDIQKWKIVNLGNSEYQIVNVETGYAITANNNRYTITVNKLAHNKNQVWRLKYHYNVVVPKVSFSFDGENKGKLVGSNKSMEYSIDGGKSWKSVSRDNMTLSSYEIGKINSKYGIKVRVKGNAGILDININEKPKAPEVKADDNKNIVEGINSSMEYSKDNGRTWTKYRESNPAKFLSDVDLLVRVAGTGVIPPGESKKLSFTSKITTPLYKAFNPMDYITIKDSEGKDISGNIEVTKNNVDVNKKGMYSVTYKVSKGENEKIITKEVEVVSDFKYLSDINYKSGKCGWRSISKDSNIGGGPIVLYSIYGKDTFKKGIGAHAPSEIVYDVKDKGYTNFESYIGLNQNVYTSNATVIFKVYVDGSLKYSSGVVTSKTPYKYVDVDIKDANEVKLVVDSNGSKSSDFAIWADAKFTKKDSAPVIEASNVSYEKDDEIDFNEILKNVKAKDIEDGDLTSKVTYTTNYTKGSTGNFDIVYSVVDSEGCKTEKKVKLIVVNSSIYVSDTNWASAKSGWRRTKKDLTISSRALRLWDGQKEVTYKKGIGTHAYSETVYNLEGKNYGYFTSYVGAAREGNYKTSVKFKVYVDGKLKAETGVMKRDTAKEFIKVNIGGAKQLRLVVLDGGNGNGNDTAIWADAKFLIADKTVMAVDTSKLEEAIKEGEALDSSHYEKDSWDNLKGKIAEAKLLLTKGGADKAKVDKAVEDIKSAITSLQEFKGESPVINAEDLSFYKGDEINFDSILSKVTVTDKEDGDLSSKVTYTTNYVKDKVGEFEIVYTAIDSHKNKAVKKVKLIVKEKFVYASDIAWVKATSSWKPVKKDSTINKNPLRLWDGKKEVTYKKGIGVHAHSEIVYDLKGKDYKFFSSYVGGCNREGSTSKKSVEFKVYVDGKLVANTGVMRKGTAQKFIKVNIAGAKEIKLVVSNGGDGNQNDHAIWADTKFIK